MFHQELSSEVSPYFREGKRATSEPWKMSEIKPKNMKSEANHGLHVAKIGVTAGKRY